MQNFRHSEGANKPTKGAAILKRVFCIAVELSVYLSVSSSPSLTSFFWFLFLLSSLLTAYLQQPSKNRAQAMAQSRGSSQHFILHGLFRLGLLQENPGGGQNLGCALARVSGATGNREELWRTGRCLRNEKWCPLRGCRAAPRHPLGQQASARHQGPRASLAFLSFLNLYQGRLAGRTDCRQEEFRRG